MATNLLVKADAPIKKLKKLSSAVYKTLGQVAPLSAEVVFVNEQEIKELNSQRRGIDKVTDVLSFPMLDGIRGKKILEKDFLLDVGDDGRVFIGSIAICKQRAKEQAIEYGHSEEREVLYLLCHGLLHLFGHDHLTEEDKRQMRALEDKIMEEIKVLR